MSTLRLESDGPLRLLTLTRPELLNRFDAELHTDFIAALTELRDDRDARAVVLASTGKVFSAGGDFELMRAANADPARATVDMIASMRNYESGQKAIQTIDETLGKAVNSVASIQGS